MHWQTLMLICVVGNSLVMAALLSKPLRTSMYPMRKAFGRLLLLLGLFPVRTVFHPFLVVVVLGCDEVILVLLLECTLRFR